MKKVENRFSRVSWQSAASFLCWGLATEPQPDRKDSPVWWQNVLVPLWPLCLLLWILVVQDPLFLLCAKVGPQHWVWMPRGKTACLNFSPSLVQCFPDSALCLPNWLPLPPEAEPVHILVGKAMFKSQHLPAFPMKLQLAGSTRPCPERWKSFSMAFLSFKLMFWLFAYVFICSLIDATHFYMGHSA